MQHRHTHCNTPHHTTHSHGIGSSVCLLEGLKKGCVSADAHVYSHVTLTNSHISHTQVLAQAGHVDSFQSTHYQQPLSTTD